MVMIMKKVLSGLFSLFLILGLVIPPAAAQTGAAPIIIRDSEIESILKGWTSPLIVAAGLDPAAVKLILVQDDQINAFVAGGANVFIYTGLIEKTRNPGELIGVIAHELGHIRGGHLTRGREAMDNASYESILGAVLGIGAAILTGDSGAAMAVSSAGQSQAMRHYLAFSRVQESSADQSAIAEFNQAEINPEGFLTFMQQLESQEILPESQQVEYIRSHPLTRDRIAAIRTGVESSPFYKKPDPAAWADQHARLLAKLRGFIAPGGVAFAYDDQDQGIAARYARAIAAYRQNKVDQSLSMVDALLGEEPDNAYFHELKGQMLMDYGRVGPAAQEFKKAVTLQPDAALIRILYAHTLIEGSKNGQNAAQVKEAIAQLDRAARDEPRTSRVHRLLATAYGYLGQEPEAQLHLAEEAVMQSRFDDARHLAETAQGHLKEGSRSWLRAQDILSYISQAEKDQKKDGKDRG